MTPEQATDGERDHVRDEDGGERGGIRGGSAGGDDYDRAAGARDGNCCDREIDFPQRRAERGIARPLDLEGVAAGHGLDGKLEQRDDSFLPGVGSGLDPVA
jgi:hypothetical protein